MAGTSSARSFSVHNRLHRRRSSRSLSSADAADGPAAPATASAARLGMPFGLYYVVARILPQDCHARFALARRDGECGSASAPRLGRRTRARSPGTCRRTVVCFLSQRSYPQSTAAIPFVASGWSELRGGRFALGFGATPIPSTGFCTTPILLTRRTQPPARPTTHLKGTQPAHSPPTKRAVLPILPNYGMSSP